MLSLDMLDSLLSKSLDKLTTEEFNINTLLDTTDNDILEMFTLEDLQFFDISPFKLCLKTDDEIINLLLEDLAIQNIHRIHPVELSKIKYLKIRLDKIYFDKDDLKEKLLENSLGWLVNLSAEQICNKRNSLQPLSFAFFKNDQISLINLNEDQKRCHALDLSLF